MKERRNVFRWLLAMIAVFMITMAGTAMADQTFNIGTLPNGQLVMKTGIQQSGEIYFVFSVPAAGYLNVNGYAKSATGSNTYGLDILLCNAYGTPIDYRSINYPNMLNGDDDIIYGLNAGTYAIKIAPFSKNQYNLGLLFTQKKNQAKYSKGKALNLKKGKKYNVVLSAGDSRSCWLKLQAPGNKKVKVTIKGLGQGNYKIKFTGNKMNSSSYIENNNSNKWTLFTRVGLRETSLRKGTYYIRIIRESYKGYSNGWLQVSWK